MIANENTRFEEAPTKLRYEKPEARGGGVL